MQLTNIFDISGSAMTAQTVRMNTTASNLANAQSTASSSDAAYKSRQAVFETVQRDAMAALDDPNASAQAEVKVAGIVESQAPAPKRYEPDHPDADNEGYVYYSNVNVVEEMANMISASRSFNVNVEVMNTSKSMIQKVLTLGQ